MIRLLIQCACLKRRIADGVGLLSLKTLRHRVSPPPHGELLGITYLECEY